MKPAHHGDAPAVQPGDRLIVPRHAVLPLVGVGERLGGERLQAEEDADAAGRLHQVQQLVVFGDVEAGLREPPASQRNHPRQQLFDVGPVDGQVVVPEPDDLALPPVGKAVVGDVGQDVVDRPHAEAGVQRGHGTEGAAERAAARRLHDAGDEEARRQEVVPRRGQALHVAG